MMAESVSSIITIALLGVAVVKGCQSYIDAVRDIDDLVDRLLSKVTELHGVVRLLNSKYQQAEPDGTSEPSFLVREKITQCRNRLRDIKPRISELKARSTETFADKAALKRKMDAVAKDIEFAIDDIRRYLTDIVVVTGACSYLEFISYMRRVSESMPIPPTIPIFDEDQPTQDESVLSYQTLAISDASKDWRAFHYTVSRCKDDHVMIEEVRSMLEQHPEPSALANILGDYQRAPLHLAAMRGNIELAHILLAFGGNINAKDTEPASVLDHALANKQVDFVTLLLDIGVDETAILERNRDQLNKVKAVIHFRKKLEQRPPREKTWKYSLSIGRKRSK